MKNLVDNFVSFSYSSDQHADTTDFYCQKEPNHNYHEHICILKIITRNHFMSILNNYPMQDGRRTVGFVRLPTVDVLQTI